MTLSYSSSNVIKRENVKFKGKITIGRFEKPIVENAVGAIAEETYQLNEELLRQQEEMEQKIIEAQKQYEEILEKASQESLEMIENSKQEATDIEKKAYEEGHSQGVKNGYEDGYKEAYEENIEKAKQESKEILDSANNVLLNANKEVANYISSKKEEILKLSISIAEQVLREKFEDVESMETIVNSVISEYELKENFVIKANPMYKESLYNQVTELKESQRINGDIFVIGDESIEAGNAIIDTQRGRLLVGIDSVLDKVKEELL